MEEHLFKFLIIRYGEIGLKSTQVRRKLENMLLNRIKRMLDRKNIHFEQLKLHPTRGRIFLYTKTLDSAIQELRNCFGIVSLSPAFEVSSDPSLIQDAALMLAARYLQAEKSFAIKTKRVGQHSFSSQEISAKVGAFILERLAERNISVNLTTPDHTLYIEIRDKMAFLYNTIVSGVSGLPYGSQGKVISLFSGGIDSPVASWMMMKRGCEVIPLYCDLAPYSGEAAYQRTLKVLQKLGIYLPLKTIQLYQAPQGSILTHLKEKIPPKYTCLVCKRLMYRIAEKLASKFNAKAIITGENLGQVASQTLDNLFVLNQSVNLPIFRPIIGFDKNEIINMSKNLGFYEESTAQVPSCGAVPEYPETHGVLDELIAIEHELPIENLIDEAFKKIKKTEVNLTGKN
jgi:thiamine biosynthesis protein ThiI